MVAFTLEPIPEPKQRRMDTLYMDLAARIGLMSQSTRSKVGAVLVKDENIVSYGWNGMPRDYPNCCELPDGSTNPLVLHSEANLFMKLVRNGSTSQALGATLYVTLSPCFECSKMILQSGIARLVYRDEYRIIDGVDMLKASGKLIVERYE